MHTDVSSHVSKQDCSFTSNQQASLEFLLTAKADLWAEDLEGWTALHHASFFGNSSALATLLRHRKQPFDVGESPKKPLTSIQLAAAEGHVECLKLLLEQRADSDTLPNGWKMETPPEKTHVDPIKVWYQHRILQRQGIDICWMINEENGRTKHYNAWYVFGWCFMLFYRTS